MIPNKIGLCLPASICYFCCSNPWQYCKEPHLAELLLGTSQIGCIVPPAKSKASHRIPVRRRFSYHFKSTEQLFSVKSSHTQVDLPIRSFLAGHHRGVESWEVTGGVAKTWTRHATTMGFGFLGFEFMSGMYDMYMWCHTCHTFKWRTTHVYCVLSTLMSATKLLPDWKVMKFKLFYWMMSRPNNEKLKRCVTKTKHHNKLSYRSQITILYTVPFTHLRIPGKCIPILHDTPPNCIVERLSNVQFLAPHSLCSPCLVEEQSEVFCATTAADNTAKSFDSINKRWNRFSVSYGSCPLWTVLWIMQGITEKSGPLAFTLQQFDLALCATTPCPKTTSQVVALDRYVSEMRKSAHTQQTHRLWSSCNIKSPLSNSVTCYHAVWRISCRTC